MYILFVHGLCGEQDDRKIIELDVLPYLFAEGEAVHLGHHDIADDDIWRFLHYEFERRDTIVTSVNLVFVLKFFL